jgi:glycogen operon protein
MEIEPLTPGAYYTKRRTRFAVRSSVAERVELCLFDSSGREERVPMAAHAGDYFTCTLNGIAEGQLYGYRVHGPYAPSLGVRCNPHKLLLDPYARALHGELLWHDALLGHGEGDAPSALDSAPYMPRSVVVDSAFDWGDDAPPRTPLAESVICELHVKGFTQQLPGVPEALRGTYAGLGHAASIAHLRALGVTAVELLPIHAFASERALMARGLHNYWGYNTLGYFAPHAAYGSRTAIACEVRELKETVRALHRAGIEVILDVVYNHTAETDRLGPTLHLRGIDNAAYYALRHDDPSQYFDATGCGNTLSAEHPFAIELVLDSLRYWVRELHVDGFRFDLMPALLRKDGRVDLQAPLMRAIEADPLLSTVKLIAEPWDVGPDGYCVGAFPSPWLEWNGRYRDDVRDFWSGHAGGLHGIVQRMQGSPELYGTRSPTASVSFVTSHDGFTLRDLVSYQHKHNEANGEENRDGEHHNRGWNCGVEGETDDAHVRALRRRQQRNMLATLLLSPGTPMICAGDELGRTQRGNNNAYCQDNEVSWLDWLHVDSELLAFVRALLALRSKHAVLRPSSFDAVTLRAFRPDGLRLTHADLYSPHARAVALLIESRSLTRDPTAHGMLLLLNAAASSVRFSLPHAGHGFFRHRLDSAEPARPSAPGVMRAGTTLHLTAHSLRVLEESA